LYSRAHALSFLSRLLRPDEPVRGVTGNGDSSLGYGA
jgi:hypothetical protein